MNLPTERKESLNDKDELYNPFEQRVIGHPNSNMGAFIHLLKSSLGPGLLATPNAFKSAGLLVGFLGTLGVGFLCTYCVHILVKASHTICRRAKVPSLDFAETSGAAFKYGPKSLRKFSGSVKLFVDISLLVTFFMGGGVYTVFISDSLMQLFNYWVPETTFSKREWMLIVMAFLLFTTQIRELKHLVPFSFFANIFIVISFAITLYYLFDEIEDPADRPMFSSFNQLPLFFSTIIFAIEGIATVMPIENSMSNPQYFLGCPGILNVAMTIVITLYATIGFFGYLRFGEDTKPVITLNLPIEKVPAQLVQLFIALAVFLTCSVQIYVPMDIIWRKLLKNRINGTRNIHIAQIAMRAAIVCTTTAIAAAVPKLDAIMGLVGAVCFSILGLLVPAVVETVLYWDGDLGKYKYRLVKNTLLGVFAIFALVSGTIDSISRLLKDE